jgi:hypothetical protein
MTIIELKLKIDEKQKSSNMLHKQLINLQTELTQLRSQYNLLEMQEFVNYLQIGEVIELDSYYSFSGFCKDPKSNNSFQSGEKIKIVKKNKKSIVIEVIKKHTKKWDEVQKKSIITGETNPGWNIRVDLDSFHHFYLKSATMRSAFDSYVKRKNALDSLFDE